MSSWTSSLRDGIVPLLPIDAIGRTKLAQQLREMADIAFPFSAQVPDDVINVIAGYCHDLERSILYRSPSTHDGCRYWFNHLFGDFEIRNNLTNAGMVWLLTTVAFVLLRLLLAAILYLCDFLGDPLEFPLRWQLWRHYLQLGCVQFQFGGGTNVAQVVLLAISPPMVHMLLESLGVSTISRQSWFMATQVSVRCNGS